MRVLSSTFGLLWAFALCPVQAIAESSLSVLAIDYPPFTSTSLPGQGISFVALEKQLQGSDITIDATFLPPARVIKHMAEGRWCASFYPPAFDAAPFETAPLGSGVANIGLYRHRQDTPFTWNELDELKGSVVAVTSRLSNSDSREAQIMLEAGFVFAEVHTLRQGFDLLRRHRVDYVFGAEASGEYYLEVLGLNPDGYQFSESLISSYPVQVWLNPECSSAQKANEYLQPQE